jgi:Ser/Thr protein kinase RdoA (MazF antagonist)
VRHSRQGAAVLRYGLHRAGSATTSSADVAYGKVYPDNTTGQQVHRFLESCANPSGLDIPRSLGYSATLHLGLTGALHGQPLPSIVRSAGSAYEALGASGRALASLHDIRQATAPARAVGDLTRELNIQLGTVQQVWPRTADHVRFLLDRVVGWDRVVPNDDGTRAVLCHGDFTPSQILLTDDAVCGVVDFDTACWSEAAMDLGRFLAHLDLLLTKEYGQSAEPIRRELADSFVAGYAGSVGVAAADERFRERIALFRSLSLASTALRACRQLKERRLSLALSLLSTSNDPTGKARHETVV